ncbi:MAG: hypothetical protein AAFW60_10235 [Pseudomonadota bacterium]
MMRALRTAALAAVLAAFSWAAVAQDGFARCDSSETVQELLEQSGWTSVGAVTYPSGFAFEGFCRGFDGGIVTHNPDGTSCVIGDEPMLGVCASIVPDKPES